MLDFLANGFLHLSLVGKLVALLIMTQMSIAAVTLYLHRSQAHRSVDFHPIISHWFRFWLWLSTGMITKEWVAVHRKHHAFTEHNGDPHSPAIFGINKVLWEGTELYRESAHDLKVLEQYGVGTPDDWMERKVYVPLTSLGLAIMLVTDVLLFGVIGITMWAIQMMWMPFFAAGVINGIGHYFGYRNYECPDHSRNIVPFGIFVGGEELHNNHHAFASSAKLSSKWWEIDLGWVYIKTLSFFHLAKVRKVPPKLKQVPEKVQVDMDTLIAVMTNRFQVLGQYTKDVIMPVLNDEKRKANYVSRRVIRKFKGLLRSNPANLSVQAKQGLSQFLENHNTLNLVYDYRNQLLELWNQRNVTQAGMLESLRTWCQRAEQTKVEVLQQFVRKVQSFVPLAA